MTSRPIVNENFPASATQLLRANVIDVLSVQEIMPGASDETVLAKAIETGRWLITFDRDYGELVFSKRCAPPSAIVFIRQEPVPPTEPAKWILELMAIPTEVEGFLAVVGQHVVRRRPLPTNFV